MDCGIVYIGYLPKGGAAVKRAVKKCILLLAGLALAAALSGCTVFDSSVEQLFTLPRMGAGSTPAFPSSWTV